MYLITYTHSLELTTAPHSLHVKGKYLKSKKHEARELGKQPSVRLNDITSVETLDKFLECYFSPRDSKHVADK
jgi:hypothetical protein